MSPINIYEFINSVLFNILIIYLSSQTISLKYKKNSISELIFNLLKTLGSSIIFIILTYFGLFQLLFVSKQLIYIMVNYTFNVNNILSNIGFVVFNFIIIPLYLISLFALSIMISLYVLFVIKINQILISCFGIFTGFLCIILSTCLNQNKNLIYILQIINSLLILIIRNIKDLKGN